ncbi:Wzz/FepE/Etk N-terminal domain-containing protein [Dokdonia sp. PRO95]|uniref:Wzz/FepE/Etk N-terminal domain-containing protein n=1 Tax=Dokdonia sp. PRO95 TaxID=1239415 RepID=UPI0005538F6E|nr:Wzz/FepE/Etk N-terminal domain-containing protein [Dokdonia sp. PRO95]
MTKRYFNEDNIKLTELIGLLFDKRKFLFKFLFVFFVFAVFIAFFSKNYYTTNSVIVPQSNSSSLKGGLGGLASLAGIDLSSSSDTQNVSPILYPQIFESLSFQREVINTPIAFETYGKEISYFEYYKDYYKPSVLSIVKMYTIGLPGKIIGFFKSADSDQEIEISSDGNVLNLSDVEKDIIEIFIENTNITVNAKEGYVEITATMPEGKASAYLNRTCVEILEKRVISMNITKAETELSFLEERLESKKLNFENIQRKLALYKDSNRFINTEQSKVTLQKLNSEYSLAYNVYNEVSKQVEAQKLQVEKDTPIFTVLKSPVIVNKKTGPSRGAILIGFIILGVILGSMSLIIKVYWKEVLSIKFKKSKKNVE